MDTLDIHIIEKDWKAAVEKHGVSAVIDVLKKKIAEANDTFAKTCIWTKEERERGYLEPETRAKLDAFLAESKRWNDLLNEIDPPPYEPECVRRVQLYGRAAGCPNPYCECTN